jgi:hypothetical protein
VLSECSVNDATAISEVSMSKSIRVAVLALILVPALLSVTGCSTNAQNGALIGAGAGALGGYVIGNEVDKH